MNSYAESFGFREWPFRTVVDPGFADVWADRADVQASIEMRLRRMCGLPNSTVQLLWADFGAGKSHTLRHIEARCGRGAQHSLVAAYSEVSVGLDSLVGLYRGFAAALPSRALELAAGAVLGNRETPPRAQGAKDLWQALRLQSVHGSDAASVGLEWLAAPPKGPHLGTLKANGISGRIDDEARVVEVVAELVRLLRAADSSAALVWLIDEFQRIEDMTVRKREALTKALVSLFNACSFGLHLFLSFSVAQQSTALHLLPPDLQSRARTFPIMSLPYLTREHARVFMGDLFDAFRSTARPEEHPHWPLSHQALGRVIRHVDDITSGRITPRALMEVTSAVLLDVYDRRSGGPLALPVHDAAAEVALNSLAGESWSREM